MVKSLLAGALLLTCCLAATAQTPSGPGTATATPFRLKAEKAVTNTTPPNISYVMDVTPEWQKERLARKGIMVQNTMDFSETADGRIYPAKSPLRENEQTYTLTVNLKYDKEEVMRLARGTAYPNYAEGYWFNNESPDSRKPDEIRFILPSGSYDIAVTLTDMTGNPIVLSASEITMDANKEITLDSADATVEINWNTLLPDGEKAQSDIPVYNSVTHEIIDEIPGNSLSVRNFLVIRNTKHGIGSLLGGDEITFITGDDKTTVGTLSVRIMPSKDYMLYFKTHVLSLEGGYIVALMSDALQSADISNNPANYKVIKPEFAYTPYQPEPRIAGEGENQIVTEFDIEKAFSLLSCDIEDGLLQQAGSTSLYGPDYKNKWIYICQDPANTDKYQVMPVPVIIEDWEKSNVCLPINTESNPFRAVALNNISDFGPLVKLPDDWNVHMDKVENPWLSFDTDKLYVWNYGCPAQVFRTESYDWGNSYNFSYIGRLGERRDVDNLATVGLVSVNGESPSDEVMENLQYGQLPEEGKINFEFTDSNVMTDGIEGKSVSKLEFDMARDDWQPPTLQIVRFIDKDGNITDRYAEGKDGVIEFYGGDFTFHENPNTWNSWYTEVPASEVTVEYTPYGTESFLPIEVENIPERDFMPGFGTYYHGSLAAVDRKSDNGWFDVRIRLTDASGNWQEQTLSPAFRIDSNVGVDAVASPEIGVTVANGMITVCGCENPAIEVYSTDGILLRRVNAASLDATTLGSGIYLVSVTDGAKRAVRKVRI